MQLWGLKTEASFDVWSIEHLIMGMTIGCFARYVTTRMVGNEKVSERLFDRINLVLVLMLSFMWEALEHYLETGLAGGTVAFWLQGVEHWSNRLFFDNLMVLAGFYVYLQRNRIVWFARIFSAVWLIVHIFLFPHSMYLHEIF